MKSFYLALIGLLFTPFAQAGDKHFNSWVMCVKGDEYSYSEPVEYMCVERNQFDPDLVGMLIGSHKLCNQVGADKSVATFSENGIYASGRDSTFLGHGKELCASYCRKQETRKDNNKCISNLE